MNTVQLPDELNEAIAAFNRTGEDIVKGVLKPIDARPTPSTIYHYTNDQGLKGILETGRLWLTDIFYLNDPSELRHGVSHAVSILAEKAAKGPPESRVFADGFANFHERGVHRTAQYFVCCLSEDGDELGQWRAYADNGSGYALGFDGPALDEAFTKENGKPIASHSTFPITYDDSVLAATHNALVEAVFPLISLPRGKHLQNAVINAYMSYLSVELSLPVLRSAMFFKHEAYRAEREYRFLDLQAANESLPNLRRRYRSHEMVRYREFDWKRARPDALTKIVIGPATDPVKASRFVDDCLAAFHSGNVAVTRSRIPYRTG